MSRSLLTALRNSDIKKLRDQGAIQLGVFDKVNMAEITSPDFPDERLAGLGVSLHQQDIGEISQALFARRHQREVFPVLRHRLIQVPLADENVAKIKMRDPCVRVIGKRAAPERLEIGIDPALQPREHSQDDQ